MGLEDSVNSLVNGTTKTVQSAGNSVKSAINLDPVETAGNIVDTAANAVGTVFDTFFSLFD